MEKEIVWHKSALKQLEDIYKFVEKDSPGNAETVRLRIVEKINALSKYSQAHLPDRFKRNNPDRKYRAFVVYRFRVSYYVKPQRLSSLEFGIQACPL